MDPAKDGVTFSAMDAAVNDAKDFLKNVDFTAAFKAAFSTLWHAKLPCFDTVNMSALNEGDRGILKHCSWKGIKVPCSAIFTTFPTDQVSISTTFYWQLFCMKGLVFYAYIFAL